MKIEKITDTQIRIYLSAEEIRQKGLSVDDLSYGAPETKKMIRSALLEASVDHAFNTKDSNLMVEITPLAENDLEILITKVDYPDEFDTRYAEFIQAVPEEESGADPDITDFREVTSLPDSTEEYNYADDLTDMEDHSDETAKGNTSSDPSASVSSNEENDDSAEEFLSIKDPEDVETPSVEDFSGMFPDGMPAFGDFQEMMKAIQSGELPAGIAFAPIDPSLLANLPGFDPSQLQNGQIFGSTIIDARTSDGRTLSPQEISGLLKSLITGLDGQAPAAEPVPGSDENDDLDMRQALTSSEGNSPVRESSDPNAEDKETASEKIRAKEAMVPSENGSNETKSNEPSKNHSDNPSEKEYRHKNRLIRMFGFDTLDDCIQACSFIAPIFQGDSMLFRAPKQPGAKSSARFGDFILCITNDHCSNREFSLAYNHLFEYNGRRISPKVSFEHIEEHYELMIAKDAVHILQDL